jgi:hypothetical protein
VGKGGGKGNDQAEQLTSSDFCWGLEEEDLAAKNYKAARVRAQQLRRYVCAVVCKKSFNPIVSRGSSSR